MKDLKNKITNYMGVIIVMIGVVNAYFQLNTEINWYQLGIAIVLAIVAYFTGKNPDGTAKVVTKNV